MATRPRSDAASLSSAALSAAHKLTTQATTAAAKVVLDTAGAAHTAAQSAIPGGASLGGQTKRQTALAHAAIRGAGGNHLHAPVPTVAPPLFDPAASEPIVRRRYGSHRSNWIEENWLQGTGDKYLVKTLNKGKAAWYRLPDGRLHVGYGSPSQWTVYAPALNEPPAPFLGNVGSASAFPL